MNPPGCAIHNVDGVLQGSAENAADRNSSKHFIGDSILELKPFRKQVGEVDRTSVSGAETDDWSALERG